MVLLDLLLSRGGFEFDILGSSFFSFFSLLFFRGWAMKFRGERERKRKGEEAEERERNKKD